MDTLCEGLQPEFAWFLNYARSLEFDQKPDYKLVRDRFQDLSLKNGFNIDHEYDW